MDSGRFSDFTVLILRITIGVIFAAHGAQKLFGLFGGSGIEGFANMLGGLGFAPAIFWAWTAAIAEGIGGLFLIAGVLPRLSALAIGITMLVAVATIHGAKGLFASKGGFEYQLLILSVCVSIIMTGSGRFSLFNKF
jgi:putative oxidoreductase